MGRPRSCSRGLVKSGPFLTTCLGGRGLLATPCGRKKDRRPAAIAPRHTTEGCRDLICRTPHIKVVRTNTTTERYLRVDKVSPQYGKGAVCPAWKCRSCVVVGRDLDKIVDFDVMDPTIEIPTALGGRFWGAWSQVVYLLRPGRIFNRQKVESPPLLTRPLFTRRPY